MEPSFVIDTNALAGDPQTWSFPISKDWCLQAFEGCDVEASAEAGVLEVEMTKSGDGFLARGRIRVRVAATCVRCLEPAPLTVDTSFDVMYVRGASVAEPRKPGRASREDDGDEAFDGGPDVERFAGHTIVFDPYVRDTILLEVPMSPQCPVPCRMSSPGARC